VIERHMAAINFDINSRDMQKP